jgi:type II secretory pathway pseudopilin PulG
VTLTELLVTITVIAALAVLTMPAWSQLSRSHAKRGATAVIMDVLEQARIAATSGQKEVWVIFRSSPKGERNALRLVCRGQSGWIPIDTWVSLPAGVSFVTGSGNLMEEQPPANVLSTALAGSLASQGSSFGSLLFLRTGRIGIPKQDGNKLSVSLHENSSPGDATILLSRATGRASLK